VPKLSESGLLLHLFRTAAIVLLTLPLYAYLSDILSVWFIAAVVITAATAGLIFEKLGMRFIPAAVMTAAVAFIVRLFVFILTGALSQAFDSAALDFSLFSFDSGFFPLFPLFIYIALCWFSVLRKPGFVIVEIILNAAVYCLLLWSQGGYELTVFPHPGVLLVFSIVFFIVELMVLLLSSGSGGKRERLGFLVLVIPLFLAAVFLFFGRYSEGASKDSGGLMQPTLFRFDFSDYVKLETEISMDNDLVMLFRNHGYLNSVYLRRFYLSGYRSDRGFFLQSGPGEPGQLLTLPDNRTELDVTRYPRRIRSEQEYFIINFDPSSMIAMNYPISVSPLTNWSGSSFLRNYRVISESVELPSWELSEAPLLEMDEMLYDYYTGYGEDQRIKDLAELVTAGIESPYDKVLAIMFYLRDSYYYSLKPGVAVDGNQLHHFLFNAKKGYCSYFAFSMALMCRSIGIPARVAAGFFIDPQSGILSVYPVREDMAHAWVEVPFEDFGWVEFDPTTDRLAPGEELEFASIDSSEYSELVEEIFSNDYTIDLQGQQAASGDDTGSLTSRMRKLGRLLRFNAGWILVLLYATAVLIFHLYEASVLRSADYRRRVRAAYRKAVRLSSAFGFPRMRSESVLEHAWRLEGGPFSAVYTVAECYLESVFSESVGDSSVKKSDRAGKTFDAEYRKLPLLKRLIVWIFPFFRFRKARTGVAAVIILILLSFSLQPVHADDPGSVSDYLDLAAREQDGENYETALKLLNDGIAHYPDDWELKAAAGDLYSDRELYNLALGQYNLALEISPSNPEVLYQKSVVQGFLNLDEDSIHTLEELLSLVPDHYDAFADLGWMYFKTFRLAEAETILLDAINIYEDSPILYMTLGTVYSGMYEYEDAERFYMKSIEMALEKGWDYFASVSYYNLSLLEHGFYNYEKALEYTNRSIEYGDRAPGYISRAEIYLGQLDFETAFLNYQQAYAIDSTPLALMGQADLYATFGLLDEALSHINEVLKHDDESWMYYFGVDPARHRMETDRILMEIYQAMAERERFYPSAGLRSAGRLFKRLKYTALGWYHERRYRQASYDVGQSNELQGNALDAAWAYFIANEDYTSQAVRYLKQAELIETAAAPAAGASYLLEEGLLRSDRSLLIEAAQTLDPVWEKLQISEAITHLLITEREPGAPAAVRLAEQLYELNPGLFITEGISFPLALDFDAGYFLKHSLRRSGFEILSNNNDKRYRYRLSAADTLNEGVLYSVLDSEADSVLFEISISGKLNTPKKASVFTAELKKRLFSIADGKDVHF